MGGQACVLYGAAEFSRDTDLLISHDDANLSRLSDALERLQAKRIAVPEFSKQMLERGHAVHFRCRHPEAEDMRIDVMSVLRESDSFDALWDRRTTLETPDGFVVDALDLADLVKAKKTQRSKDWPMLARLVEAHYGANRDQPNDRQIDFWLRETRTPSLLIEICRRWPELAESLKQERPLLRFASAGDERALEDELFAEERIEREKDRQYWRPLKAEIERFRHER